MKKEDLNSHIEKIQAMSSLELNKFKKVLALSTINNEDKKKLQHAVIAREEKLRVRVSPLVVVSELELV